ncbi:MAG: hypothetical protein ACLFR1_13745 [Spirochaetia bacterium]
MSEERFSQKEMKAIIERAIEIQHGKNTQDQGQEGVSKEELLSTAQELGISPEIMEQAAEQVSLGKAQGLQKALLGGKTAPKVSLQVPEKADDDVLNRVLTEIPELVNAEGSGRVYAGELSWNTSSIQAYRTGIVHQVRLRSIGNTTVISVTPKLGQLAAGLFGGLVGGVGLGVGFGVGFGVGIGALGSVIFASLFPPAVIGGSYLLSRFVFRAVSKGMEKRARKIADRISEIIRKQ